MSGPFSCRQVLRQALALNVQFVEGAFSLGIDSRQRIPGLLRQPGRILIFRRHLRNPPRPGCRLLRNIFRREVPLRPDGVRRTVRPTLW